MTRFIFRETPDGPKIGKIVAIKSKFVHAHQESCREYEHLFPTDEGMETVKLDTSDAIDDKERFQPVTEGLIGIKNTYSN